MVEVRGIIFTSLLTILYNFISLKNRITKPFFAYSLLFHNHKKFMEFLLFRGNFGDKNKPPESE